MLAIFITLLTFVLIIITLFMMLVILMQRPNTNAGMGAAFGGGVTESTFGAETTNVLTRATKWSAGAFFVVAVVLYMLYLIQSQPEAEESIGLPSVTSTEGSTTIAEDPAAEAVDAAIAEALLTVPEEAVTEEAGVDESATPAPAGG